MLATKSPTRLRALEIVVERLEDEQAADIREFEALYPRSDELLLQISERNERLRGLREIIFRGGRQ